MLQRSYGEGVQIKDEESVVYVGKVTNHLRRKQDPMRNLKRQICDESVWTADEEHKGRIMKGNEKLE